jgi:phosphatidylglycerol:prolipoprotein diacylglycerol transferase
VFPRISDLINYLFDTGIYIPVYTYGFFLVLAFTLAFFIFYLELKRRENKKEIPADSKKLILWFVVVIVLSSLIGLKLFHILDHWRHFLKAPLKQLLSFNGVSFYGGLIFGSIAALIYANKKNISHLRMLDIGAPGILIGYGIGRLGCQLSGDGCWGIPNTIPTPLWLAFLPDWVWGFRYPHNVFNVGIRIENCLGANCFILPGPVFPTPLYESFIAMVSFTILWSIRKKISIPGWIFSYFLILYSISRFFIEFIRINPKYSFIGLTLSQAQYLSIMTFITGIISLWYFRWISMKKKCLG